MKTPGEPAKSIPDGAAAVAVDRETLTTLVHWALRALEGAPDEKATDQATRIAETARQFVQLLDAEPDADKSVRRPCAEMLVEAFCRRCEGDVDVGTLRHAETEAHCVHENVPEGDLDVWLACPACGSASVAEVNVGEVHDPVVDVVARHGSLVVVVDQSAWMDRNGSGWVCESCSTPLRLPHGGSASVVYV